MRLRLFGPFVIVSVLLLAVAAHAQPRCALQTVTGTYAVQITGTSLIGSLAPSLAPYQLHGGVMVLAGRWTIAPNGSVQGPIWGVYLAEPVETTFSAQVTVDDDCTGELVTAYESFKMAILDNGKEIRMTPWDGFGGSVITARRIARPPEVPQCGPQTFKGTYMMRCEGYELTGEDSAIASSWSLFTLSAADGVLKGRMWGKRFGVPVSVQTESGLSGTYEVAADCTVKTALTFEVAPGFTYKAQGVLFDEGKQGFGLPLGIHAGEEFVAPMLPQTCVMTRVGS